MKTKNSDESVEKKFLSDLCPLEYFNFIMLMCTALFLKYLKIFCDDMRHMEIKTLKTAYCKSRIKLS